jgi:hypothetical protein
MIHRLKRSFGRMLPNRARPLVWWLTSGDYRSRSLALRRRIAERRNAQKLATPAIWSTFGGKVATGPFQSMRYLKSWRGTFFTQKLLGTYELELRDVIETFCTTRYDTVIDIGAAEGYYACGLAFRMPDTRVLAFEAQTTYHAALRRMSAQNGIADRIDIRGSCSQADLDDALRELGRTLLICDAEGAELDLLDPEQLPALRFADMLVEVHEEERPGVTQQLEARFSPTHTIQRIEQRPRSMHDLPDGITFDPQVALSAMDEARGRSGDWLCLHCRETE